MISHLQNELLKTVNNIFFKFLIYLLKTITIYKLKEENSLLKEQLDDRNLNQ